MHVVVTGGSGFLGAHLARALVARGDTVTSLDVAPPPPILADVGGVAHVRCDVGAWADLAHALKEARPALVFHVAGILSAAAEERPRAAWEANAIGTYDLLEAASLLGIERIVFTSTIATYGPGVARTVDESTPQRPTTLYGLTKVLGELLGEWAGTRYGLGFRAVRLPAIIGPGRGPGGASAYASLIVSRPAAGLPYAVPVPEGTRIPLISVDDAVRALLGLAEAAPARLRRRTYNVAGFSPTAGELAAAVSRALPEARLTFEPDAAISAIVATWPERMDDREAAADWGWAPADDLEATVTRFVASLAAHPGWA
jgi:threonine 3-dehydrogenase